MSTNGPAVKPSMLLTGASGRLGRVVAAAYAERYDLLLTDVNPLLETHGFPFVQADLADAARARELCQGIDIILHLGAAGMLTPWEGLLASNIIGLYNLFQAACDVGCGRVIFTSSIQAVDGYPADVAVEPTWPVRPSTLYGASKACGEALASFYAHQTNLSVICLRLGMVLDRRDVQRSPAGEHLNMVLTYDDLIGLLDAAIAAPDDLRFGIYHGVSDNCLKRLDITTTRADLGYLPRDDAHALAPSGLLNFVLPIVRKFQWLQKRVLRR